MARPILPAARMPKCRSLPLPNRAASGARHAEHEHRLPSLRRSAIGSGLRPSAAP